MKQGIKFGGTAIVATVVAIVAVLALVLGVGLFKKETATFRGEVDQTEKVQADGNFRIAAYEEFYDLCSSIQGDEDKVGNLKAEAKTASPERQAQINISVTAIQNSRSSKVRKYNSNARKEDTRGAFRASDLPYQLNIKEETSCSA